MKLSELRSICINKLTNGGIERPSYVTDILISRFIGISTASFITSGDIEITSEKSEKILDAIGKRLKRVPLSYILGEAEFYGRAFVVGEGCLIPRPETELLVEEVLHLTPYAETFADWCTGSGCIGITMILERNQLLRGWGIDSSELALKWAAENRKLYNLENSFELMKNSDASKCGIGRHSLDFVVANPPYIPSSDIRTLMPDVSEYEPTEALDGGSDGMDVYRMLFQTLPSLVKKNGIIGFETAGNRQAEKLIKIAPHSMSLLKKVYDYSGILRHIIWVV
jgi:release factor glutamine methyltransferase